MLKSEQNFLHQQIWQLSLWLLMKIMCEGVKILQTVMQEKWTNILSSRTQRCTYSVLTNCAFLMYEQGSEVKAYAVHMWHQICLIRKMGGRESTWAYLQPELWKLGWRQGGWQKTRMYLITNPANKAVDGVAILTKWFCDVIWFKLSPRGKETCAFKISYENKYKS